MAKRIEVAISPFYTGGEFTDKQSNVTFTPDETSLQVYSIPTSVNLNGIKKLILLNVLVVVKGDDILKEATVIEVEEVLETKEVLEQVLEVKQVVKEEVKEVVEVEEKKSPAKKQSRKAPAKKKTSTEE